MRALIDRHHHALFYSLQRLFEDRLGVTVYTPIGHDWWDKGYWRFGEGYGDDRLAQQFLNTAGWALEPLATHSTNRDGHHPERLLRGVTYEQADELEWDYVVATVQDNQAGFARLAQEWGAQYVLQVGNTNQWVDWSLDPTALVSSEVRIKGRGIVYHQEIAEDFEWTPPRTGSRVIRSFVNCFGSTPCSTAFEEARVLLPQFAFYSHGIDGPNGNVETVSEIASLMGQSLFGWHDKIQGDGFGHVLHDWAAIGRPIIGHGSHYRGLMGEIFWRDLETCIDLDRHSVPETVEIIRSLAADPVGYRSMCAAIRSAFETIDYAAEAEAIRDLLTKVPA